jgi:LuxR family transcriptional regulator, maltose regulon positive regulatory protein
MNKQISLLNKISSLQLTNPVKRRRLFDLLSSTGEGGAFWISGPGGSGKSTLVASFLEDNDLSAIWYQVDALDKDPATSFYYIGEAVRTFMLGTAEHLPFLTPEYLPNIDSFLLLFFERLYSSLPAGTWLVFDNVQDAPAPSLIPQLLVAAVQQLPPTCRLAVISRDEPFPAMARFLANRLIRPIGRDSLSFTVEEFCQLMERENVPGGKNRAEKLHELTGGWVAGAILMLMQMRGHSSRDERFLKETPENIFSYFAGEVLEKIDAKTRAFLLETSQLPFMTVDLVKEVTEMAEAALLEDLLQKNFFLERRYLQTPIYQYHPLFHAFLNTTVERLFAGERLTDLRRRSARVLESRGLAAQAVEIYARIGDYEEIREIVIGQARNLVSEGRHRTLALWLTQLPAAVLEQHPYLMYWRGVASIIDSPLDSRTYCTRAYQAFRGLGDVAGQLLCWSTMVEGFIMMRSGFSDLDFWIDEGEKLGKNFDHIDDTEAAALFSSNMLIALLLRNQGHPDLPLWQKRCESLLDRCGSMHAMAALVSGLFWSYHYLGEVGKAGLVEARLNLVLGQPGIPAVGRLTINMLLALAAVGRGDHQRCLQTVADTLEIAEQTGIHSYDLMVISFGVYTGLTTGDLPLAELYLEKLEPLLAPHALWDHAQYHFLKAWLCLEKSNLAEAHNLLLRSADFINSCGNPYTIACVDILKANLQLDYGHPADARRSLEAVRTNERLGHNKIIQLVTQLALADCGFCEHNPLEGARYFRKAVELMKHNGLTLPFPMVNRRLGHVVSQALDMGISDAVVYDLVNRWKLKPPSPEMVGIQWPWPLKLFTFGGLEMVVHGKSLEPSLKPPRKLFELLILLITAKRSGIAKDTAAYRLWPDSDGDRAMQNLNTALHRLRKLLVEDEVILLENGRLMFNPRKAWGDCWHFEWLEQQALSADTVETACRLLINGLRFYRGNFAPEHQGLEVAVGYTEQLKNSLRKMTTMAKSLLGGGNLPPSQAEQLRAGLAEAEQGLGSRLNF